MLDNRIVLIFISFLMLCTGIKIRLLVNTESPIHVVNPLSPSVAMGLGIFNYGWVDYFQDEKFLKLASALSPMYLRVGGTKADFTHFVNDEVDGEKSFNTTKKLMFQPHCQPQRRDQALFEAHKIWSEKQVLLFIQNKMKYGIREALQPINMTSGDWKKLNEFCECVGWKLVFGLNLLDRNGTAWNSTNAEALLKFTENRYHVNWELGNEPNSYFHKTGVRLTAEQVGDGFLRLKRLLIDSPWWSSSIILGPDANRIGTTGAGNFLSSFLSRAGKVVNGVTFHQYYLNGRKATPADFLNPNTLNKIIKQIQQVKDVVNVSDPRLPLWLGETASAYGGGAPGLSNSYIDGFTWLDKLGMTSRMGVDMVVRQSFIQSYYDLVDRNFDPLPDYWLTLLYKRLVGNHVLNVTLNACSATRCYSSLHGNVRVYAHCANRLTYPQGSIVLYFINLKSRRIRLTMKPFQKAFLRSELYLLQPSIVGNLTSSEILLNGNVLRLTNTMDIPPLQPSYLHPTTLTKGLKIPAHCYGFLVITNVRAKACFRD